MKSYIITTKLLYNYYHFKVGDELLFTIIAKNEYLAEMKLQNFLFESQAPTVEVVSIKKSDFLFIPKKWEKLLQ